MKLLCDVCENAVASVVCCADEAALCSSCDSRVHAANKLASKHQRVPLLSETLEPTTCDICQERPSFFFCVEDRALLCRECDVSIHSANALAAKHRRYLLTGIKVGMSPTGSTCQETNSAVTLEQHMPATSPAEHIDLGLKKPGVPSAAAATVNFNKDDGGVGNMGPGNKAPSSSHRVRKPATAPAPALTDAKSLRSYTMTKDGTLSMASNINNNINNRTAATADTRPNTTTISIQRISAGQRAPFVAPVLSSIRASLLREEASKNDHKNKSNSSSRNSVMMDVDNASPLGNESVSDYLNSGIPGWRLDELLTDLVGVCDSGRTLSPAKEDNVPGFSQQEQQSWFAELDFLEEDVELSPSQEEDGVALVPEMPSPPTHSGLVPSRGKPSCPAAESWAFDHLFTGLDHPNEFSVVPDIGGRSRLSSPSSYASPPRDSASKKRKYWLHV